MTARSPTVFSFQAGRLSRERVLRKAPLRVSKSKRKPSGHKSGRLAFV